MNTDCRVLKLPIIKPTTSITTHSQPNQQVQQLIIKINQLNQQVQQLKSENEKLHQQLKLAISELVEKNLVISQLKKHQE